MPILWLAPKYKKPYLTLYYKFGFTLIEALVVLAIMVIVGAFVAYPEMRRMKTLYEKRSIAQAVASAFYFARTASFTYPSGTIVEYVPDKKIMQVCADENESDSCNEGDIFLQVMPLNKAESINFNFSEGNSVIFKRGLPKQTNNAFASGSVTIDNYYQINVSRMGRVRIEKI